MTSNNEKIKQIFSDHQALISSQLIGNLKSTYGMSDVAARKAVSRASSDNVIQQFGDISFTKNRRIYYLTQNSKMTPLLIKKILEIFESDNEKIFRFLQLLKKERFLFLEETYKILSCPINNGLHEKKQFANAVISQLKKAKLIQLSFDEEGNQYIYATKFLLNNYYKKIEDNDLEKRKQQLYISKNVLQDVISFFSYVGLLGWSSEKILDTNTLFSNYYFDAYSASFVRGTTYTNQRGEKKGRAILFNCIIHRQFSLDDFKSFEESISNVEHKRKKKTAIPAIIPVIVFVSMNKEAFARAKRAGYMVVNLETLFTKEVSTEIKNMLQNPLPIANEALLERISNFQGELNNVRGALFQYLIIRLITKTIPTANMYVEKKYESAVKKEKDENEDEDEDEKEKEKEHCECDIIIDNDDTLIIFELKCMSPSTKLINLGKDEKEKDSVKRFFQRTRRIVERATKKKIIQIFVTNTGFKEDAISYLKHRKNDLRLLKSTNIGLFNLLDGKLFIDKDGFDKIFKAYRMSDIKENQNKYINNNKII